jgi:hypothetical protein
MLDFYRLPGHLKNSFNEYARNPDYQLGNMLDDAIQAGYTKANDLADILYFLFHHSDRKDGRFVPIQPHETAKVKEWNGWREIAVRRLKHGPGSVKPRSKESEDASREARKRKIIQYLNDAPIATLRKTHLDGTWMSGVKNVLVMALEGKMIDATYEYWKYTDPLEMTGTSKRPCHRRGQVGNLFRGGRHDAYKTFVQLINKEPLTTPDAVHKILKTIHELVYCPTSLLWRWRQSMASVTYSELNSSATMKMIKQERDRARKPNCILHPYYDRLNRITTKYYDPAGGTPFSYQAPR